MNFWEEYKKEYPNVDYGILGKDSELTNRVMKRFCDFIPKYIETKVKEEMEKYENN